MALVMGPIVVNFQTDSYEDYTGSPLTFIPGTNVLKSITPIITRKRVKEEIPYSTTNGQAPYAHIDAGIDIGTTIQVKYIAVDLINSTDKNMYYLAKGMHEGGTLPGGFSTWVTTNQLPAASGNPMIKWKPVFKNSAGTTQTYTYVVSSAAEPVLEQDGEHYVLTVTWLINATPSVA